MDPIAKKVGALVQDARGYIAEQNLTGSPGSRRSMRWRIRIPVEQFDSFVDRSCTRRAGTEQPNVARCHRAVLRYRGTDQEQKVEEQALNKILQERSGKLEDVLKIEIELSRVRGEIEQLEGKIRVLENLSSLATLTLNVREREKYAPPPPVVADFRTQIARTWDSSMLGLANQGKSLVLWAVNWVIWVPFLLVGALVGWVLLRWMIRGVVPDLPRIIPLARAPIIAPRAVGAADAGNPSAPHRASSFRRSCSGIETRPRGRCRMPACRAAIRPRPPSVRPTAWRVNDFLPISLSRDWLLDPIPNQPRLEIRDLLF